MFSSLPSPSPRSTIAPDRRAGHLASKRIAKLSSEHPIAVAASAQACEAKPSVRFVQPRSQASLVILRLPAVRNRVGISRTSIYQRMSEGSFPKAIHLGPKAIGWLEHEVEAWVAERVVASRPPIAGGAQ